MNLKFFSLFGFVIFLGLTVSCKKGATGGGTGGTPDPTATPQSTPDPTPSATPSATPAPTPDPKCVSNIPDTPVKMQSSSCGKGFEITNFKGVDVCVARSSCRNAQHENSRCLPGDYENIRFDCHPWVDLVRIESNQQHLVWDAQAKMISDPGRGHVDAFGRSVVGGQVVKGWEWNGICAPRKCRPAPRNLCPPHPPVHHWVLTNIGSNGGTTTIDGTPWVCNGAPGSGFENYCQEQGFNDNCCKVRQNNDSHRDVCDEELAGQNSITGVFGPTWGIRRGNSLIEGRHPFEISTNNRGVDIVACNNPSDGQELVCTAIEIP